MHKKKEKCAQLGKRIKTLRELRNLSQTEYAVKLGINRAASISDYENGKREPELATLCKIAELDNTSLNWLLLGEGPRHRGDIYPQREQGAKGIELLRGLSIAQKERVLGIIEGLRMAETEAVASKKVNAAQ